jgi:hypothetical protein
LGYCSQAFETDAIKCTSPVTRFFFNSVAAITSDLINTSNLNPPADLINQLATAKRATNAMFVLIILRDVRLFIGMVAGISMLLLRPTFPFFLSLLTFSVVAAVTILAQRSIPAKLNISQQRIWTTDYQSPYPSGRKRLH